MTDALYGKPWAIESTHNTYESANEKREKLGENDALQVKIKRSSAGLFTVRTRSVHVEKPKRKEKKIEKPEATGKPRSRSEKRKLRQKRKEQKRQ
jgi:hypothetical protein